MFVYEPSLLMIGDWTTSLHVADVGHARRHLLAAGLFGYLLRDRHAWERAMLIAAALLLIKPG